MCIKLKCHTTLKFENEFANCLTKGKEYEIKVDGEEFFAVLNDLGELHYFTKGSYGNPWYTRWFSPSDSDDSRLDLFLKELGDLEEKYGVYISADYEEEIDYDYDENPYTSHVSAYVVYQDKNGNKLESDKIWFYIERMCLLCI